MGGRSLKNYQEKKNCLTILQLFLFVQIQLFIFPVQVFASNQDTSISDLENWLFFTTFSEENIEKRLSRIEDRIFGETIQGTVDERIAKLNQLKLEREKNRSIQKNENQKDPGEINGAAGSKQSTKELNTLTERQEYKLERQKIAAQAAREQEIQDLLKEGTKLWRNRDASQALEIFKQIIRLDPQNANAHFSVGIISESCNKLNEAMNSYQYALRLDPANRDYQDAVNSVKRKLANDRQGQSKFQGNAYLSQANLLFKKGDYFSALDQFKQADDKFPNQALLKHNIGTCYLMLKDYYNALTYFKEANKLEPKNEKFENDYKELLEQVKINKNASDKIQKDVEDSNSIYVSKKEKKGKKNKNKLVQEVVQPKPQLTQMLNQISQGQLPYTTQMQETQILPQISQMGQNTRPSMSQMQQAPYINQANQMNQNRVQVPYMQQVQQTQQSQMQQQDPMSMYGFSGQAAVDGIRVSSINSGGRASKGGLRLGDIIRTADGEEVFEPRQINKILLQRNYANPLPMLIFRNGNLQPMQL